jgi:Uma2 family endonuclease
MAEALEDEQVELIHGYLVKKSSKRPPHIWAVDAIREAVRRLLPACWCRQEAPVRIPDFDEPEPDVAVVRGARDDYRDRLPGPEDVKLVVEVSDSSLELDRGAKLAAYAKGLIPVYWIVNLVDRQVEVYTIPIPSGYATRVDFKPGEEIPVVLDGVEIGRIAVVNILPAR